MKPAKPFLIACLIILGSCVVVPAGVEDSSTRPHALPPPSDRPLVQVVDLEALPARFVPGKPIDFVVKIANSGGHGFGFDVGVFHETRLVGWITGVEVPRGLSNFRLKDDRFTGDPGSYIVRVRYRGSIVDEKGFFARPTGDGRFVIEPGGARRDGMADGRHTKDPGRLNPPGHDGRVSIVDLEALPQFFVVTKPIDFVVKIENRGPVVAVGLDIGIFHEGRLVGWEMGKALDPGMNVFKVRDDAFTGDVGSYIVRVRWAGRIVDERRFATRRVNQFMFTLDPSLNAQEEERRPHTR